MTAVLAASLVCDIGLPCSNEAKCCYIAGCLWTASALFHHTETARSGFSACRHADYFYRSFTQTIAAATIVWYKLAAASITLQF